MGINKIIWVWGILSAFAFLQACKDNPAKSEQLTGLQIESDSFTIHSGGFLMLRATVTSSDGSVIDVTDEAVWSNAPALVGLVEQTGKFRAVNNVIGVETVTVRYQGEEISVDIDVTRRAGWLAISPVLTNIQVGENLQFRAAVTYQDYTEDWVTDKVEWSVTPGLAATIDENGLLTTQAGISGKETVKASYHGWTEESEVEVQTLYQSRFEMVEIPAGTFVMGDDNGPPEDGPEHQVFVSRFEIGKYEVTNAEYAQFLTEALARGQIRYSIGIVSRGKPPFLYIGMTKIYAPEFDRDFINFVGDDENGRFEVTPGYENYPVGRLHWYGAKVFCDFYGLRLPTEAEWEKASRGGQQLEYGTSDGTISSDLANMAGVSGGADVFEEGAPVGSFPPNPYGIYDMAGNVHEFIFDMFAADYYSNSPAADPSGPGPVSIQERRANIVWIIRGGDWISQPPAARTARRNVIDEPHDNVIIYDYSGFRVARSLP